MTETRRRRARSPYFTVPSAVAKTVSSPPLPTFSPGWIRVPRWRTRIDPDVTNSPSNTLDPSRFAFESRPFLDEPPAFVLDISHSFSEDLLAGFFAAGFFAAGFLAVGFFAAGFLVSVFSSVDLVSAFFAAGFFVAGFLAAGFFAAGFSAAAPSSASAFFAVVAFAPGR